MNLNLEPALLFADASNKLISDVTQVAIFGVPFDATATFRAGAKFAPNAIRQASYNFESYSFAHKLEFKPESVADLGNLSEHGSPDSMLVEVETVVTQILNNRAIPLILGGEHTLTIGAVRKLVKQFNTDTVGVIIIDAHLDFRHEYLGNTLSHACITRRLAEEIGIDRILILGVRSCSKLEYETAIERKLRFYGINNIPKNSTELSNLINSLGWNKIYLSIDLDCIDPCYIPAVANPEPCGLQPNLLKSWFDVIAPYIAGADLVELTPTYDHTGQSVIYTTWLLRELLSCILKT